MVRFHPDALKNYSDVAERFMYFSHKEDEVGSIPTVTTRSKSQKDIGVRSEVNEPAAFEAA